MSNILTFPGRSTYPVNPQTQQSAKIHAAAAATVLDITDARMPKVFYERDTIPEHKAREFFAALKEGFVRGNQSIKLISNNLSDELTLEVRTQDGIAYRLPDKYYILLTEKNPDIEIDDYVGFFTNSLDALGITVSMESEDVDYTHTILEDDELELYHPESIQGIGEHGERYSCEIYNKKHRPDGAATVSDIARENITLLDIMLLAIYDAEEDGIDIVGADMDVVYEEEGVSVTTTIYGGRVIYLLHSALCRVNPLYKNMKFIDAMYHYFNKHIKSHLVPIEDEY